MMKRIALILCFFIIFPFVFGFETNLGETKYVYLTFDDGPNDKHTTKILDILDKQNVKATFFVVGSEVEKYPNEFIDIYNRGHKIGIHSYSHNYKEIYSSNNALLKDIERCKRTIQKYIPSYNEIIYRFPGGSSGIKKSYQETVTKAGYTYYDWNCSCCDAEFDTPSCEQLLNCVKKTYKKEKETIVLLHDLRSNKKASTYETLENIILFFKKEGCIFRTL